MTIDHELIAQVQSAATEEISHRIKTLIACYVGFVGMLDTYPELRDRAIAIESALRKFCATGVVPPRQIGPGATKKRKE